MTINVFLGSNDAFTVSNSNVKVTGASGTGTEAVTIGAGLTGTQLDANVERVNFSGNLSSYTFKSTAGTGVEVRDASSNLILTIPSINTVTKLAFSDGSADMVQTGSSTFTLGGQTVSGTATTAITSSSMGTNWSTTTTSSGTTTGQTFTLTVSGTTGSFDNLTGTSGNDTYVAGPGALETGDVINAGAGTDKIEATYTADATVAPTLSAAEQMFVRSLGADVDTVVSLTNATGVTELWADRVDSAASGLNDASVTFTGATTSQTLGVKGGTSVAADRGDVTFTLTGVTGSADTVAMAFDGAAVRDVVVANVETVNIAAGATTANRIDGTLTLAAASKVTITGAANTTIDATDFANTGYTVDATALTGKLNITLEDQTSGNTVVTGGSGDDTIFIGAGLDANDTIDGGTGTNIVGFSDGSDLTAATGAKLRNFTGLDITGLDATIDLDNITGTGTTSTIKNVYVGGNVTAGITITDLAEGGDVSFYASEANGFVVTQKGAADAGSNADSLTINVGTAASTANVTAASITVADVETINFVSKAVAGTTTGHTVTASTFANATTVNFSGDEQLTFTTLGAAAATNIDASAMTDKFIMTNGSTAATILLLKGGSADDTLVIDDAIQLAGTTVQGNGGADSIDLDNGAVAMVVKYALQSDSTGAKWDKITNFDDVAEDTINLAAFGFTGAAIGGVLDKSATVTHTTTGASADFTISAAAAANFFNDAGVDRAVAFDDNGTDTFLFIDVNKDGDWSADADMAILLVGNSNTLTTADFVFA